MGDSIDSIASSVDDPCGTSFCRSHSGLCFRAAALNSSTQAVPRLVPGGDPAFSASSQALAALGPSWRTPAQSPHGCFVSVAAGEGPIPYLYRRIPLRFPAPIQAEDGAVAAFRYRAVRPDGGVSAVLNCVIPATERAREAVARRFRVPTGPEEGGIVIQGCVIENSPENPCPIDPIVVIAPPAEEPCSDCNEPVPPPPPGGDGSGGGGGTDPCLHCGPSAPTLSCTSGVPRGGAGQCTVGSSDGSIPDVVSWEFTDDVSTVAGPTGGTRWMGPAIQSGIVTATLADGNGLQASFGVADRGWKWATHALSEYSDGTGPACFDHTPTFGQPNAMNLPMDAADCAHPQRQIQPDSYAPAGDGFTAVTVPGGPNQGLHYVQSARYSLKRKSTYNSGLWPNAPAVPLKDQQQAACGNWANWQGFSRCMGVDPDAYIAGTRAHEGWGTTGHNGHFSAAYDAVTDPNNDPMIFFDQRVGSNSLDLNTFILRVREGFHERAKRADDATLDIRDGGTKVTGNWSGTYHGWAPGEGKFLAISHSN